MYDELLTRLREDMPTALANCDFDFVEGWSKEAADAIEELSKDRDNWKATAKEEREMYWHWFDLYQKDVPCWIPVTERLPEKNGPYLCCWKASADEKKHIARIRVWRADTGWMNAYDEPMSKYVTHWMPLPQPPKE